MTPSHPALELLDRRRSVPALQLGEPGPDEATLLRMLASAVRVPDHGRLVPFRFLRIQGPARAALGRFMAERLLQRDPQAPPSQVEKALHRFASAPLVLAVVARLQAGHKVPEQEQLLTAGCVCFALLQAAQACGFGAQWLTGWMAYDREVARHLGLAGNEQVVGFIHIGTPRQQAPERERPDPRQLLTDWTP
ncbi:nitroreductase family protein [Pseudoxanthomonas taiwanensis]|jgi:Nitroreductase|uniref:Putative NAD(P)H nitroreductase n=1 Tax=Pseudoxanthomonas taiwanensis TaxID=176598 RepID=A0A921TH89_9GAMM|nr:nitroreductase [Pseudoxanthomonas taiwanensis]KAF1687822.1 nitroreductase [Pseudoxanthomonas taiwanensis]